MVRWLRRFVGRLLLVGLAAAEAMIGIWAAAAPHSFWRSFPGGGWHWVSVLGPYDEHLTRDFGGLSLALMVVTLAALLRPTRAALVTALVAWEAWSIPHIAFHAVNGGVLPAAQNTINLVALALTVVVPPLAAGLLWPGAAEPRAAEVETGQAA